MRGELGGWVLMGMVGEGRVAVLLRQGPIALSPGRLFCLWGACGQGDSDEQTAGFYVSLHVGTSLALSTNYSPSHSSFKAQLGSSPRPPEAFQDPSSKMPAPLVGTSVCQAQC